LHDKVLDTALHREALFFGGLVKKTWYSTVFDKNAYEKHLSISLSYNRLGLNPYSCLPAFIPKIIIVRLFLFCNN